MIRIWIDTTQRPPSKRYVHCRSLFDATKYIIDNQSRFASYIGLHKKYYVSINYSNEYDQSDVQNFISWVNGITHGHCIYDYHVSFITDTEQDISKREIDTIELSDMSYGVARFKGVLTQLPCNNTAEYDSYDTIIYDKDAYIYIGNKWYRIQPKQRDTTHSNQIVIVNLINKFNDLQEEASKLGFPICLPHSTDDKIHLIYDKKYPHNLIISTGRNIYEEDNTK